MALTAAERAKRYREKIKQNPDKYEHHKKKELKRLQKHNKKISELTPEEQNNKRILWREQKRTQKIKQNEAKQPLQVPENKTKGTSKSFIVKHNKLRKKIKTAMQTIKKYKVTINNLRKKMYRQKQNYEKRFEAINSEKDKLQARQEVLENTLQKTTKMRTISARNNKFINTTIEKDMITFYTRDDVSRITAGKKETRTLNKNKRQIRYLLDTLRNLYQVYKDEGGEYSYSTFFRYKPFYVLSPTSASRDTCMCIKHSNMNYMFAALKQNGVITHTNTGELLKNVSCDTKSFCCMYNKCVECKNARICYNEDKLEDAITWHKWVRVDHKYEKAGHEHVTKKTIKQQMKGAVKELIPEFEMQLKAFKTHVFNWGEQYRQYKECVTKLTNEEIAILCDFSENYQCKYNSEIQSTHFGASKNSITLHTGIIFGKSFSQSFVTVSDDNCHEPNAVWAHLLPAMKRAKELNPDVKVIHYFTDGPSSQYRQKKNFYLLNFFVGKLKLSYATWSFSEAGHGKSLADGIGGAVKRQLDKRVFYGSDITNAADAHQILQRTMKAVQSFYVSTEDVKNIKTLIPEGIRAVPGTMQLHQVISAKPNEIEHRCLSCFCGSSRGLCRCYSPKIHRLLDDYAMVKRCFPEVNTTMPITVSGLKEDDRVPSSELPCLKQSESIISTGSEKIVYKDPVLGQSQFEFSVPELSESLAAAIADDLMDFEFISQPLDISLKEFTQPDQNFENSPMPPLPDNTVSWNSLKTKKDYTEKPISANQQNTDDHTSEDSVSVKQIKIPDASQPPKDLPLIKRNEIIKPGEVFLHLEIDSPKTDRPDNAHQSRKSIPLLKRVKILKPGDVSASSRTFSCHLCKTRQPFIRQRMVHCMVCKNLVCFTCSGTTLFDYICDICLDS